MRIKNSNTSSSKKPTKFTTRNVIELYSLVRKLGCMDSKKAVPSEPFAADDFKKHFKIVSEARKEQTQEEVYEKHRGSKTKATTRYSLNQTKTLEEEITKKKS